MDGSQINGQTVTENQLLEQGYRKYRGQDLAIYYNKALCVHAGNCVRGNPAVYQVQRRPWIIPDHASVNENIRVINTCPSGALKYIKKEYADEM